MRIIYFLVSFFLPLSTQAQTTLLRQKIDALFDQTSPKPQVLLVGTFHFAGEQVDANTTPTHLRVNMLSPTRQRQVADLVRELARFKPTKIVIESAPGSKLYIDSVYRAFCNGQFQGNKRVEADGELLQIGFKLAKRLGHTELFPVDAQPFRFQFSPADSLIEFTKYEQQSDPSFAYWDKQYDGYSALQDSLKYYSTLNDYLRFLNADKTQARSIGRWLVTTKRGSNREPIGADKFISRYYNRNLRIYSNVQRIVTSSSDRVLILYGNTHLYILKHLFEASPEFTVLSVLDYLK